jgi:hypothetical protein
MIAIPLEDTVLAPSLVIRWSSTYPACYDRAYYDPWLCLARNGNVAAIERLTEWKNVGLGLRAMRLSSLKRSSLQRFLSKLYIYRSPDGRARLEDDYRNRAPVYSILWSHVLYGSPIFDVYTNVAFVYFQRRR